MTLPHAGPALSIRGLSKHFSATKALVQLDVDVAPGQIHALVGGNGSGKSTTVKILAGVHRADTGTITVNGHQWDARHFTRPVSRQSGLRFVHQDLGLFPDMTVAENLALGTSMQAAQITPIRWRAVRREARALLDRFELTLRPDARLGDLRPSEQTMVAIARALNVTDGQPGILVLDEPTASLPGPDADLLLEHLHRHRARGQTVIYISHRLAEVRAVADTVTVLRDGRNVLTAAIDSLTQDQMIDHIVGPTQNVTRYHDRATGAKPAGPPRRTGRIVMSGLRSRALERLDLTIAEGEIVGLTGLAGSGFDEPLQVLFGLRRASAGTTLIDGRRYAPAGPRDALREGFVYSPADRHQDGCFLDLSLRSNLTAPRLRDFWSKGWLSTRRERSDAEAARRSFGIKAASVEIEVGALSGGNQQKVLLARCLALSPRLLLLAEPTQGVDIAARNEIYDLIRGVVRGGTSVLVSSTDLDELARLCDRVLVVAQGRVVTEHALAGLNVAALASALHLMPKEAA
ncbi:MAG: sugar ABC transporter ATP-binding protein [Streptomyces sp.]|nr:sugar ABC transporter ATP-binding protein [Streptomyces sp.]